MKIRAIRLREVGIFRDPIAVERFSGGLDVLAGPNELGKSTILRALERLFFYPPSSKHKDIEQLRPHGGGAPLIEVDFEAAGRHWRLRKQFLTGRGSAELTDLVSGQTRERGPDAHARALELIGQPDDGGRGRIGLLWVSQGDGPRPLMVGASEKSLLLAAIGGEIADVASGRAARIIGERVAEELAVLVTSKHPKPRGAYEAAMKAQSRLTAELNAAQAQARSAEERAAQLDHLRSRHAGLADPSHRAGLANAASAALRTVEEGRRAREQQRLALATRRERDSRLQQITSEITALRDRRRDHAALTAQIEALRSPLVAAETAEGAGKAELDAAADSRAASETQLAEAQSLQRRRDRTDALAQLRVRHAAARAALDEQTRLTSELTAIGATDGLVRKAEAEQRAIGTLQATLDAAAPRVAITYAPGVRDAIRVGGKPLLAGAELRPVQPLVLEIAGVGQITITPVAGSDIAETRADLQAHQEELAATLAAMGVTDLESARKALPRRRDLETRLAVIASQLAAAAPDGITAVEQRLAAAERAAAVDAGAMKPAAGLPDRALLLEHIAALENTHRAAIHAAEAKARETAQQSQITARLRATLEAALARLTALDAHVPQSGDACALLAKFEAELTEAAAAAHAAVREVAAWAETAPGDDAWQARQDAAARAQEVQSRAASEIASLQEAIARIEGELDRGGENDIAQRIDELSGELAATNAQISHFEQEAAALSLLQGLIAETQAFAQDRFLAPVLARIAPYLDHVLPHARLQLGDTFAPSGLARGGGTEATVSLSGGTQEQLAVLTRLGFGRLLAERGQPAPVILDDALVYSDDARIERLFEVLRTAAEHHQIIVLTCRSRVFEPLGGNRLSILPWQVG